MSSARLSRKLVCPELFRGSMNGRNTLSVCMIVKNEAAVLGRCLRSVTGFAEEIIVVDTGSDDDTVAIAEEFGATVIRSDWRDDFSYSRNISLDHASCTWILWLDADDVVPRESVMSLEELKAESPDKVFAFVVRNEKPGGTGSEFVQARMFPRDSRIRFERRIHEQVMPSALRSGFSMVTKPVVIEHHGYADPDALRSKAERNVRVLMEEYGKTKSDPVSAVEIADSLTIMERWEDAEKWYRRTLAVPSCSSQFPAIAGQAWMGLGNIQNRRGAHAEAVRSFGESVRHSPDRPDALYGLAVARELIGRPDEAVATLERILTIKSVALPVGVDFRQTRIKAYLRLGRLLEEHEPGRVEPLVARALDDCGERPEIQNMAGRIGFRRGKHMDALHRFEQSLRIANEGNLDAYIGLCMVYRIAGRNELIEKTLNSVRPLFSHMPRYWAFRNLLSTTISPESPPSSISSQAMDEEQSFLKRSYDFA
ncbi:MAG: glycosyltransferase [Chitinivibrionales bacterium]|nr:glycosyltransferase [Chitinivibrionales bacterium]MBD3358753.1 glycosyltransferase [Chitinivibrionales bacterium]